MADDVKVHFQLEQDEDGYPPVAVELRIRSHLGNDRIASNRQVNSGSQHVKRTGAR